MTHVPMSPRTHLSVAMLGLALSLGYSTATEAAMHLDVFTGFENINTAAPAEFTIGSSPNRATFSGNAFSNVVGIGELYRSGNHAWMVNPNSVGTINFETNASVVEFFARTRSLATGNSVVTAFDDLNQEIDSVILTPGNPFEMVSFTGSIDHIEFTNIDSTHMNAIDDFGYSAIPVPPALLLFGSGLIGAFGFAWRKNTTG